MNFHIIQRISNKTNFLEPTNLFVIYEIGYIIYDISMNFDQWDRRKLFVIFEIRNSHSHSKFYCILTSSCQQIIVQQSFHQPAWCGCEPRFFTPVYQTFEDYFVSLLFRVIHDDGFDLIVGHRLFQAAQKGPKMVDGYDICDFLKKTLKIWNAKWKGT